MTFDPTPDQQQALKSILDWFTHPLHPYLTLGGFAGTGKTSLLATLRIILKKINPKLTIAFCAYTGKASRVLANTLSLYQAKIEKDTVSTIHSLIYAPIINDHGQITSWHRKANLKAGLIIIDEASMIDRSIWEDLLSFGIPLLAVGDHGQLPPIRPGFNLMIKPDLTLATIHRQAAENPIIKLSFIARETGKIPVGNYGQGIIKLNRFDSATGNEVENLMQSQRHDLLVLTGYNHSRLKLNQLMREYYSFESSTPVVGDRVICLKNNRVQGIYNGMTGVIKNLHPIDQFYQVDLSLEDNTVNYSGQILARQFNQPTSLAKDMKQGDSFDLFDFGYALTVHKAQGSQAKRVLLFEERNQHMTDDDWRRWLYTGITRAEEYLTIIGT